MSSPPPVDFLIFGGTGFVGTGLARAWVRQGRSVAVVKHRRDPLPGTLPDSVTLLSGSVDSAQAAQACLAKCPAKVVVNAAGQKNVRACEADPEAAFAINAHGAEAIAMAAQEAKAAMVQISTDLVHACETGGYHPEDPPQPRTVYGRSKREGETRCLQAHPEALICRTGGLYGGFSPLLRWLQGALAQGETVDCFTDVINSPTYGPNLAEMISAAIEANLKGLVLHCCGPQAVSRHTLFETAVAALGWQSFPGQLRPIEGGQTRDALLLQPDASLDVSVTQQLLPDCPFDAPSQGFARLRDEERTAL
ncbi:MAG: SDR family oxidoreductase [Rhodospirillaceae bacterium]